MGGYEEMLREHHPTDFPSIEHVKDALADEDLQKFVDLRPYTNMGCFTVLEHTSALRCYSLFRGLGLRHLPVLSRSHEVSGIITRQNLLAAQEGHLDDGLTPKPEKQKALLDEDLNAYMNSQHEINVQ